MKNPLKSGTGEGGGKTTPLEPQPLTSETVQTPSLVDDAAKGVVSNENITPANDKVNPAPSPHSVRVQVSDELQGELTEPGTTEAGSKLKGPVELNIYWDESNSPEKAPK